MTERAPLDSPGVRFPPPLLFIAGLALAWLLERGIRPLPFVADASRLATPGALIVAIGAGLVAWGMVTFRAARTAIVPMHAASRLVDHGPYRFTRNPMYSGLTLAYLGIAVMMNSAWPLLVLPIVLALLVRLVIRREETYLQDAFGQEYSAYRDRVRRWL
jgi:protein-S-isoprenylcysteine O-methyltransferase Ste14